MSDAASLNDPWDESSPAQSGRPEHIRNTEAIPPLARLDPERELPERASPSNLGNWPADDETSGALKREAGDRVGRALGNAANRASDLRERLHHRVQDVQSRLHLVRSRASDGAREKADNIRGNAQRNFRNIQSRVQHVADEHPIHFVLGSVASAFVIGLILGWWRRDSE